MADIRLERDAQSLLAMLRVAPFPDNEAWDGQKRQAAIAMLWRDFLGKYPELMAAMIDQSGGPSQSPMLGDRSSVFVPDNQVEGGFVKEDPTTSNEHDVLLVIPLPKEAFAALVAFEISPLEREHANLRGPKVWFKELVRQDGGRNIKVVIAVITKARNIPAAINTLKFLERYKCEAAFLCGIGGGVRSKVELGDVVATNKVIDVGGGSQDIGGFRPRPDPIAAQGATGSQLKFFVENRVESSVWRGIMKLGAESIVSFGMHKMPPIEEIDAARFGVDEGTVVAGDRLIRDGSLPLYLDGDDRIRSCDMEGSGFGQACQDREVEWGVFRGISDFGDPEKSNAWQSIAAFAAVRAAKEFLMTEFRLKEEMAF